MMAVEQGQRIAAADAERAQALQDDPSFGEPGEQIDKHTHLPLWHAICAFKGVNPAHWALPSPDQARTMQRHTTGDVSKLLKEIVRLHDKAAGHAQAGGLKGFGDTAKSFKTTLQDLIEWAEKVGEVRHEPRPMQSAADPQTKRKDLDAVIEKPLPEWLLVTGDYIVTVMKAEQANTVKKLYRVLEAKAGPESPFDKGTGQSAGRLYVRQIAGTLSEGTLGNFMPAIKKMATR